MKEMDSLSQIQKIVCAISSGSLNPKGPSDKERRTGSRKRHSPPVSCDNRRDFYTLNPGALTLTLPQTWGQTCVGSTLDRTTWPLTSELRFPARGLDMLWTLGFPHDVIQARPPPPPPRMQYHLISVITCKVGRAERGIFPLQGGEKSTPNEKDELPDWKQSQDRDPSSPKDQLRALCAGPGDSK